MSPHSTLNKDSSNDAVSGGQQQTSTNTNANAASSNISNSNSNNNKEQQQQQQDAAAAATTAAAAAGMSKLGRKGDPRMHRAVAARLADPDMTLLDALRRGGFDFPLDACGHDSTLVDADNVTLGQRKNQLSRRLRLARQQQQQSASFGINCNGNSNQRQPSSSVASGTAGSGGVTTNGETVDLSAESMRKRVRTSFIDPATGAEVEDDVDMGADIQSADRMAKFHPNFHPLYPAIRQTQTTAPRLAAANSVAVSSLVSTATSVGLTLEQLAMRLSDTPTLFQTLSSNPDPQTKLKLAVNLFKTDSRALLQKSMLHAGFAADEVVEGNSAYMQVALKTWEVEGKRLEILLGCSSNEGSQRATGEFCECMPGVGAGMPNPIIMAQQVGDTCGHDKHHAGDNHGDSASNKSNHDHYGSCTDLQGRHVHRLSGKCGHKAIIHQPKGRPAHIDFVVDGKIECYEGIKPVGPKGQGALWPSGYKCIDLACPTDPARQIVACGSTAGSTAVETVAAADNMTNPVPKQLSLTDVDFDGKEWNVDFFSHDGQDDTLLGLIKLGDGDKEKASSNLPTIL